MRRKKKRAKRKDAPVAGINELRTDQLLGRRPCDCTLYHEDVVIVLEPERIHTTVDGRGCVSRLRDSKK